MPRNGSGIYTLPAGNPVTPGTTIDAAWANDTLEDLANEVTNSLSRTGAGGMLAPFRLADGNVTAPGIAWLNETNSGLYRSGAGSTWMSILGVNTMQFSTVGVTIPFGKALTAAGNATVGGTLAVTGATTILSNLAVTGTVSSMAGFQGSLTGNVTAASGSSSFNNVTISGSLDMDAGSSATITGLSAPTNSSDAANKGYVDAQVATRLALSGGTMTGAINTNNFRILNVGDPSADTDAVNKQYVDAIAQGIDAKGSCLVATTGNVTLSGNQTIDGVAVGFNQRVLVWQQTNPAENGIYYTGVNPLGGPWVRAADADTWAELVSAYTFIEQGATNGNNGYICTVQAGGTLGTTPVTWTQFSGAGQINAGAGLTKTGNTLNVGTASATRIVVNADNIDLATTGVTPGTYTSVTVDAYGRATGGANPTTLGGYGITDAYTQTQVNTLVAAKLSLTGGTMSGAIAMGANKITGLADPTLAQDAATKNYIDTIFGSTTTAAASAAAAASSASAASTSATNAANSATAAAGSATSAASSYTTFNNQYLGSKTSDPTTNNSGGALVAGNLYWNSTAGEMRVYNGSAWVAAYIPAAGYLALSGGTMTGTINFAAGQTIAGYLTTSAAASTYQTQAAMSAYLTSATAASTYQTQAGMSAYLTSATAASTYAALSGATFTGNVGVGAAPSYKLDVYTAGTNIVASRASATNSAYLSVCGNATTPTTTAFDLIHDGSGTAYVFNRSNAPLILGANNAEKARIAAGGNFLIGSSTDNGTDKLQVTGSMSLSSALRVGASPSAGTSGQVLTSAGSGAAPTWSTISSGGMTLLATLSPSGVTSVAATSLAASKELVIVLESVSLDGAAWLNFALSDNNGSTYGTDVRFTNSSTTPTGKAEAYRTDASSTTKPYYAFYTSGFANGSYSTTGVINAVRINNSNGSLQFQSGSKIYIYGMN